MLIVVRIWLNRELFGRRLWPADVAWNRSPNGWTPAMPSRYASSDSTSFSVMFLVFSSHRPSSARLYPSSQREGSFVSERVDRFPRFPGLLCVFDGSGRHPLHRYRQRCSLKTSSFTILARKVSIESASVLSDIFARMVRPELSICRRTSSKHIILPASIGPRGCLLGNAVRMDTPYASTVGTPHGSEHRPMRMVARG